MMNKCPACDQETLSIIKVNNALSRFKKGVYICPDCGIREAMEGYFWWHKQKNKKGWGNNDIFFKKGD